jgi:hypothetical protein
MWGQEWGLDIPWHGCLLRGCHRLRRRGGNHGVHTILLQDLSRDRHGDGERKLRLLVIRSFKPNDV